MYVWLVKKVNECMKMIIIRIDQIRQKKLKENEIKSKKSKTKSR